MNNKKLMLIFKLFHKILKNNKYKKIFFAYFDYFFN